MFNVEVFTDSLIRLNPSLTGLDAGVAWVVTLFGSIWLGVVMFTIFLKILTLPLDYFSRASMRKMSVKMERMRPELEKLQEQYADNKEIYNQKMMALYKKENVNLFGSCLPTIVTMVVFIIILSSFNNFSAYQQKKNYCDLVVAYNSVVYDGIEYDETQGTRNYTVINDGKVITIDKLNFNDDSIYSTIVSVYGSVTDGTTYNFNIDNTDSVFSVKYDTTVQKAYYTSTKGFIQVTAPYIISDGIFYFGSNVSYTYSVIIDKLYTNTEVKNSDGQTFKQYCDVNSIITPTEEAANTFITNAQQFAAKTTYNQTKESFLWVHNIWQPDSAFQKEVPSTWTEYNEYNKVTALMESEKNTVNGYFILIILTAASTILQQLIMNKSQKAQMELQSVNGQGVQTQKIMMWIMPVMMGAFALMWTSALAIYIVVSSVFSIFSTLIINKTVDMRLAKEEAKKASKNSNRSTRKTVVKKQPEKEIKKGKEKIPANDFLSYDPNKKYNEKAEEISSLSQEEKQIKEQKRKQSMSKKKAAQQKAQKTKLK